MESVPTGGLAATKVRPPGPPAQLVGRSRLEDRLVEAVDVRVPLILVSAPAGSGKSTLVAAWAARSRVAVAWLQLDDSDADPVRFWRSVAAAVRRASPSLAQQFDPLVTGSGGDADAIVPAFVNLIEQAGERLVLVLDDYHLIDDRSVHTAVEQLVDRCPPDLTIVVVTRADPPFRLGRFRVRDRIREIRATDLRFQPDEATTLLGPSADVLGDALEDLYERTEGWAAGLVLARLSIERTDDVARFVRTFRGDDHLVASYLTDELLASLDPAERTRLVEAATLHRLTGDLIDAVTGSTDGARWLSDLADRNQLVIRLDSVGEWFRYHHLFRDLLLMEARRTFPDRLPDLHRRAAAWFEEAGLTAAAVDHLLEAGDRDRAMYLMRFVGPDLLGSGQLKTMRNILRRLSDGGELDAICTILSGWDHYLTGRYETAQLLLDRSYGLLTPDVDAMRAMPLRINLALGRGDVATALAGAEEVVAAGDVEHRPSELTTAVGAAFAWAGRVDDARSVLALASLRTSAEGRVTAHAMSLVAEAVVAFHAGDRAAAAGAARRALDHATASGLRDYHGIAPAIAIHASLTTAESGGDVTVLVLEDLDRAVRLARRAATTLGLVLTLALCGDLIVRSGREDGRALIEEARRIAEGCPDPGITGPLTERLASRHRIPSTRARADAPVEPLSDRELTVLRYLPSPLSLPEIARELYVSPNTVKTQCSAIYRKLGVSGRQAAVQAARERRYL